MAGGGCKQQTEKSNFLVFCHSLLLADTSAQRPKKHAKRENRSHEMTFRNLEQSNARLFLIAEGFYTEKNDFHQNIYSS